MTTITVDDIGAVKGDMIHVLGGLNEKTPPVEVSNPFNLSLIPLGYDNGVALTPWSGTVTLQRGFLSLVNNANEEYRRYRAPNELLIWNTVAQYTGAFESIDSQPAGSFYRIVVTAYTAGKLMVALTQ